MSLGFRDYDRKASVCEFLLPDITAGGADYDALVTAGAAMVSAIETISVGQLRKEQIAINEAYEVGDADAGAYRELGMKVFWADTTAETEGHFTIPCPDPVGAWLQVGTDIVDITDTDVAALITATEANVLSPDGNAVNVSRIVIVGRRS
jgi:hypothetical protein